MKTKRALQTILALGTAILGTNIQAQTTIDTIPLYTGNIISPFGLPNTATLGQTITCPASDTVLTSFSILMNLPATDTFKGYVYAWNGIEASGASLYTSAITSTTGSVDQIITFNTGRLNLTSGSSYVLFGSASEIPTSTGRGQWGDTGIGAYSGGSAVFLNNGTDASQWTTTAWYQFNSDSPFPINTAFKATFIAPVPEPSTMALALLGGLSLVCFRRRK